MPSREFRCGARGWGPRGSSWRLSWRASRLVPAHARQAGPGVRAPGCREHRCREGDRALRIFLARCCTGPIVPGCGRCGDLGEPLGRLRQSRVQARPPSSCSGGLTRAVSAAIRPRTASRTKWKTCPALCPNLSNPPSLPLSSCVAFCVSPACPTTRSTASANMKRLFDAKCARSCLRLMPWIAANHRTEGAVSVSAAGKDCRSTVPSNVNLRARRSSGTAKFLRSMRAETMAKGGAVYPGSAVACSLQ
jgi:hypothetical protein